MTASTFAATNNSTSEDVWIRLIVNFQGAKGTIFRGFYFSIVNIALVANHIALITASFLILWFFSFPFSQPLSLRYIQKTICFVLGSGRLCWHVIVVFHPCEHSEELPKNIEDHFCGLVLEQSGNVPYFCWNLLAVFYYVDSCVIVVCLFVHNSLLDMSFKCQFCGKEGALRCSKCKRVYYCSKQCQVRDWPIHKSVCGKYLKDYTDAVAVFIFWCTEFLENERFLSSIDVFWRKCCRFGIVTNIGINHYCVCSHSFWLQKELSPYRYEINVNQYSHWW